MSPITLTPTTSENLPLLREFAKYLDITSIIQDFIRSVIFAIYHGLYVLAKGARSVFEAILGFLDFTESTQLNELFQAYKPLIWVLMILSLMFVGYLIMFNKLQHRENVVTNIIILLVMMTILPMAITQFNSFVRTFLDDANQTQAEQQSATVVDDIFLSSIVDVELLARSGWPPIDEDLRLNQLTVDSLETFDINTRITDTSIHTALDEKLVYDQVTKMERSKLLPEILKEYYYRFSVNYWRGIFGLGVLAFVYIIYAIITARLILELAINKILALLISASDLHSGQRMKGAIIEIIKAYLTIIGMIFMTVIFGHFVNWLYHS
ncbi:MAG TPA: hypothetical protein GXZ74_05120, partial [Tissierellia bacterium]|nr:hypothetical protein [Tissierellia bacterium]